MNHPPLKKPNYKSLILILITLSIFSLIALFFIKIKSISTINNSKEREIQTDSKAYYQQNLDNNTIPSRLADNNDYSHQITRAKEINFEKAYEKLQDGNLKTNALFMYFEKGRIVWMESYSWEILSEVKIQDFCTNYSTPSLERSFSVGNSLELICISNNSTLIFTANGDIYELYFNEEYTPPDRIVLSDDNNYFSYEIEINTFDQIRTVTVVLNISNGSKYYYSLTPTKTREVEKLPFPLILDTKADSAVYGPRPMFFTDNKLFAVTHYLQSTIYDTYIIDTITGEIKEFENQSLISINEQLNHKESTYYISYSLDGKFINIHKKNVFTQMDEINIHIEEVFPHNDEYSPFIGVTPDDKYALFTTHSYSNSDNENYIFIVDLNTGSTIKTPYADSNSSKSKLLGNTNDEIFFIQPDYESIFIKGINLKSKEINNITQII